MILKRDVMTLWGLCVASTLCVTSCTVGPDFVRPEPPHVERYTSDSAPGATISAEGHGQRFEEGARIVSDWWRLFNSSKLDAVIQEAFANNPNLQAAQASLRQSQDNLSAGYGVFYPQVDAGFDVTRQKLSLSRLGGNAANSTIFNLYTLSATVSYALDIFGGQRRAVEGLQAQVDFQRYMVLATYLTLSGNIVNAVIARAAYRKEIKSTEQTIALEKEQLGIAELQAQAGTVSYASVLSLKSQLAAIQATLPPLRQKVDLTDHLLATLMGRTPAEWTSPQMDMEDLTLPADLPLTLPSQLVRQRPDILAAEAQLHAASAEVGVATAALFPSFTLNGAYGFQNTSFNNLFKNVSSIWSLGPTIAAPLFHGGTLQSMRSAAVEGYNESLANYRQAVLGAFSQVADTLRALEHDAETLDAQSQALDSAEKALRLIQTNYEAGLVNYVQVLIADTLYHQAEIGYLQALGQRYQDTVAFFVALGGGWWNAEGEVTANHEPGKS